jgi:hypothetical protein
MSAPGATLRAVLGYAAASWRPFPCEPGSMTTTTPYGFKDGANDLGRIRISAGAERSAV